MKKVNLKMVSYLNLPPMPACYISALLNWHDINKVVFDKYDFWLFTRIKRPEPFMWNQEIMDSMPYIYDYLTQTLERFIHIERIALLETIKPVPDHTDSSAYEFNTSIKHEPVSIRIMLRNSNKDNFWVCPLSEEHWGKPAITYEGPGPSDYDKIMWKPTIGRWWALNNWVCYHGSNWHEDDQKTIMTIHGKPTDEYLRLLDESETLEGIYHPHINKYF